MSGPFYKAGGAPTRERILVAAQRCFASLPYDKTGLRDIGRLAGVDVAYVHRSFGSKKQLFARSVEQAALPLGPFLADDLRLPVRMAEEALGRPSMPGLPSLLEILSRSLSSLDVADVVGEAIAGKILDPLRAQGQADAEEAALLTTALLIGMQAMRNVLPEEEFEKSARDRLSARLAAAIEFVRSAPADPAPPSGNQTVARSIEPVDQSPSDRKSAHAHQVAAATASGKSAGRRT